MPAPYVGYCHICGKKLKGSTEHGLEVSRSMHYKKRHNLAIRVIATKSTVTLIETLAQVAAV